MELVIIYHKSQLQFNGSLIPTAPADMFMALGKRSIYIILAKMVVIRMGVANTDNPTFALSDFDSVYGKKLVLCISNLFCFHASNKTKNKENLLVTKK
jgi:hypothetical protein